MNKRIATFLSVATGAAVFTGLGVGTAAACGFLVAPNGAIVLERTTTLASWSNGVEDYVTSFEFASDQASFGSLIPLPAEPTIVEKAGEWTLQRLRQEVSPPAEPSDVAATDAAAASDGVEVLREVQIDSLDITILRGGGKEVAAWAQENGFDIPDDVTDVLEHYGNLSPYFMAAKFDAERVEQQNLRNGQGTPIHLEIPLDRPWVPLRILGAGKGEDEAVTADVFLLTPGKPKLGKLDKGVTIERSVEASADLLDDLRSDQNSSWIPAEATLTHVVIDGVAKDIRRDLVPLVAPVASPPMNPVDEGSTGRTVAVSALGGLLVGAFAVWTMTASRRRRSDASPV